MSILLSPSPSLLVGMTGGDVGASQDVGVPSASFLLIFLGVPARLWNVAVAVAGVNCLLEIIASELIAEELWRPDLRFGRGTKLRFESRD